MTNHCPLGRRALLGCLIGSFLFLQGCGFGWLYMRLADSHRIKGRKILLYDTTKKRFINAQQQYRWALDQYNESILYDELGNMEVYHKAGFTCLLLEPPNYKRGLRYFEKGIKLKRKLADQEGRSDELKKSDVLQIQYLDVKDEDYAMMHAGVGTVYFLQGIRDRDDELLKKSLEYFWIADEVSRHRRRKARGFINKILDAVDLREIVTPPPYPVLAAKVRNYQAEQAKGKGNDNLTKIHFDQVKELLERAERYYPGDPNLLREWARYWQLQGEPGKALEYLDKAETQSYADQVVFKVLRGELLVAKGKDYDKAIEIFNSVLEVDDRHKRALVGRGTAYAYKGNIEAAQGDLDTFLALDKKDPELYLAAGKIYTILKLYDSAEQMFLKGYYIDPKSIELCYNLAKTYQTLRKRQEMQDVFAKLKKLAPESSFVRELAPLAGR